MPQGANAASKLLSVPGMSLGSKLSLLGVKYWYLAAYALHIPTSRRFHVNGRRYRCDSFLDPAFLVQHLVDMRESLAAMKLLGRSGLTVIDVGAHHGETVLGLSLMLDKPTIYSFEPNPSCYQLLEHNTRAIPARLFNIGLGETSGQASFSLDERFSAWNTFAFGSARPRHSILAEVRRGDDIIDLPRIDLLKIDVEGFEYQVLQGLQKTLARCRYLMLEMSLERPKAYRFDQLAELLGRHRCDIVRASLTQGGDTAHPSCIDLCIRFDHSEASGVGRRDSDDVTSQ